MAPVTRDLLMSHLVSMRVAIITEWLTAGDESTEREPVPDGENSPT